MVKNIATYKEWIRLTPQEKFNIENEIWDVDFREGRGIRRGLLNEFKKKYISSKEGVITVRFGYYKYLLGIFVTIKKGYRIRLPRKFDIFFVEKEYI